MGLAIIAAALVCCLFAGPCGATVTLRGSKKADTLTATTTDPTNIYGLGGNDVLAGNEAINIIKGGSGNDKIFAHGGDDKLYGSAGIDSIFGDDGQDFVQGGDGNDVLAPGNGDDWIVGGGGSDTLFPGRGCDIIVCNTNTPDVIRFGETDFYPTAGTNELTGPNVILGFNTTNDVVWFWWDSDHLPICTDGVCNKRVFGLGNALFLSYSAGSGASLVSDHRILVALFISPTLDAALLIGDRVLIFS